MGTVINIFTIFLIIVSIAVIIYYVYDYLKYKKQLDVNISTTQAEINAEKKERVTNLKYVVEQVNNINKQISSTTQETVNNQQEIVTQVDTSQGNILAGLSSAFSFSDSHGNNVPIANLPGSVTPNMELLKNVSATMGLTANDLNVNGTMTMCSSKDPSKCIKFPDNNGNLYLTDMGDGGIILDATKGAQINNGLDLNGSINIYSKSGVQGGTISAGKNQIILNTEMVGVGSFNQTFRKPQATLHVNSPNIIDNLLELTNSEGNQVMTISPDGAISLYINGALAGVIESVIQDGVASLQIKSTNLVIEGDLQVDGKIQQGQLLQSQPLLQPQSLLQSQSPSPNSMEGFANPTPSSSTCPTCKVCKKIYNPLQTQPQPQPIIQFNNSIQPLQPPQLSQPPPQKLIQQTSPSQQQIQVPMQQPMQQPMQVPMQQPMQQPMQVPMQVPMQQPMQQPYQQTNIPQNTRNLSNNSTQDYIKMLQSYDRNPFTNGQCAARGIKASY